MKVQLPGTGAPLALERAGLGLLVTAPGCKPLLVDTCGGLELYRQLAKTDVATDRLKHVILTHRHGDHIGGTMALFIALNEIHFYGLPDTLEAVRELLTTTYPHVSDTLGCSVNYHSLGAVRSLNLAGFNLEFFEVQHRVPTVAVRISHNQKTLAFSADSLPCPALIDCARDSDLFICDALCESDDRARTERVHQLMHPTAAEAAEMAVQAGARKLALTHISRYGKPEQMLSEAQAIFPGEITVPSDLDSLEV